MLSIISKKRKMPRQIIRSDGIFSAKNVKHFFEKSKKGSKMTKRHPSGWNTFQKSYVIINVQKNTFYFKKVGTNHTGLPLL